MARKLYRSRTDSMLGGVCSGLAEYLDADPTIIRIVFVLLALLGGHGILLYLILWVIMPPKPETTITPPTENKTTPGE